MDKDRRGYNKMECSIIRKKLKNITINEYKGQFEVCIPCTEADIEKLRKISIGDMEMITIEG